MHIRGICEGYLVKKIEYMHPALHQLDFGVPQVKVRAGGGLCAKVACLANRLAGHPEPGHSDRPGLAVAAASPPPAEASCLLLCTCR